MGTIKKTQHAWLGLHVGGTLLHTFNGANCRSSICSGGDADYLLFGSDLGHAQLIHLPIQGVGG